MRIFAATAAVVLVWLYTIFILLMEVGETCTMGGDGLFVHLIIGGPMAAISASLVFFVFRDKDQGLKDGVSLIVLPAVAIMLIYHSLQVWSVSILGHHSCGADYDYYLDYVAKYERWIPLMLFCIDGLVCWMAARSLAKPGSA